jgi:hypothetical protein
MNKYQISIDSSYDRNGRLDSTLDCDIQRSISVNSEPAPEEFSFFSDDQYKDHSEQLVDAFKQYSDQINFVMYEYDHGELWEYNEVLVRPSIPYMDQMQKHLNAVYEDSFPNLDLDFIQSERMKMCQKMAELMITPSSMTPHGPTFETIITNRININCPGLKPTENTDPDADITNFYLRKKIFEIVFEVVNNKRQLNLKVKPTFLNDIHELIHGGGSTIARGDEQSMAKLKSVLEELVADTQIRSIITRYNDLKTRLDNDSNIIQFRKVVSRFYEFIHGGQVLGGPGSCDLCVGRLFKVK